jgi:hypothetical protein
VILRRGVQDGSLLGKGHCSLRFPLTVIPKLPEAVTKFAFEQALFMEYLFAEP